MTFLKKLWPGDERQGQIQTRLHAFGADSPYPTRKMSSSRAVYAKDKFGLGFTLAELIPGTPHANCEPQARARDARGGFGLGFAVPL